MKQHLLNISFCASSLLALTACSDLVDVQEKDTLDKTPIELTVGVDVNGQPLHTRTVITDGTDKTLNAFTEGTSLYMLLKSEDKDDDTKPALVSRTIMFAIPQTDKAKNYSEVNYSASNEYDKFVRFWEDSYSRSSALSILAVCTPGMGPNSSTSDQKAWSIGGNTVFAATANNSWSEISTGGSTVPYAAVSWPVGASNTTEISATDQSTPYKGVDFIKNEDLCFSNNIGDWSDLDGKTDARLKFNSTGDRKFDSGTLIFYHALSKLTFQIKMGAGFSNSEFQFQENTNIKLTNFYNQGTFNMEEGEFINTTAKPLSHEDIKKIYQHASLTSVEKNEGYKFVLDALVIPGTEMNDDANAVTFTIGKNTYKITRKALYNAIIDNSATWPTGATEATYFDKKNASDGYSLLKAGVHYVFTFTVGKTKIENISASLVPWETVEAVGQVPDNAYVKLQLKNQTGSLETGKPKFDFYRAKDPTEFNGTDYNTWAQYKWETTYKKAEVTETATAGTYRTDVFWEDNETFYHFRTVNRGLPVDTVSSDNDYVTMYSGPINDTPATAPDVENPDVNYSYTFSDGTNGGFNDYIWGAPFKKDTEDQAPQTQTPVIPTYSLDYGFCNNATAANGQIYKAIGATKDLIFFYQFHMMSNIYIDLATTGGADMVDLTDATIKLVNYTKNAKLQMGDAKIVDNVYDTEGALMTADHHDAVSPIPEYDYSYRVIPQALRYTTGGQEKAVGLIITCKDKNVYIIEDLSQIKKTGTDAPLIDKWLPGKNYYYKFTLKKTGIETIQATIVDWDSVTAEDETVQIK